jgi:hypothetical protein
VLPGACFRPHHTLAGTKTSARMPAEERAQPVVVDPTAAPPCRDMRASPRNAAAASDKHSDNFAPNVVKTDE